jgi:hypothetical protein
MLEKENVTTIAPNKLDKGLNLELSTPYLWEIHYVSLIAHIHPLITHMTLLNVQKLHVTTRCSLLMGYTK